MNNHCTYVYRMNRCASDICRLETKTMIIYNILSKKGSAKYTRKNDGNHLVGVEGYSRQL